jgi:hypothetical protein
MKLFGSGGDGRPAESWQFPRGSRWPGGLVLDVEAQRLRIGTWEWPVVITQRMEDPNAPQAAVPFGYRFELMCVAPGEGKVMSSWELPVREELILERAEIETPNGTVRVLPGEALAGHFAFAGSTIGKLLVESINTHPG